MANFYCYQKEKKKTGNCIAKLIILWYDYLGENHSPLVSNGMASIPKTVALELILNKIKMICIPPLRVHKN